MHSIISKLCTTINYCRKHETVGDNVEKHFKSRIFFYINSFLLYYKNRVKLFLLFKNRKGNKIFGELFVQFL